VCNVPTNANAIEFNTYSDFADYVFDRKCQKCNAKFIQDSGGIKTLFRSWLSGQGNLEGLHNQVLEIDGHSNDQFAGQVQQVLESLLHRLLQQVQGTGNTSQWHQDSVLLQPWATFHHLDDALWIRSRILPGQEE
jgi:hypothetical protein